MLTMKTLLNPLKHSLQRLIQPKWDLLIRQSWKDTRKVLETDDTFLTGTSANYIDEMYHAWLMDATSVHVSWDALFRGVEYTKPPNLAPNGKGKVPFAEMCSTGDDGNLSADNDPHLQKTIMDHLRLQSIIRSYQFRGHLCANLDPLGIVECAKPINPDGPGATRRANELVTREYNTFDPEDMDRMFTLPANTYIGGTDKMLPLREIIDRLENIYCDTIGVEYLFITNMEQSEWIKAKFEAPTVREFSADDKFLLLKRLIRSARFEAFLARKFASEKRFGLEGCEVMVPALKEVIDVTSALGVDSFMLGMAHRGRLNVLANICRKPLNALFNQFMELKAADSGSGDVKYHLGTCIQRLNRVSNKNVKISLIANASHLESSNPIVQGKTKAEQFMRGDTEGSKVMAILIHGDAAFSGQGVVFESFHLSDLPDYTTHGCIHLVINNQVGFTTDPRRSRSSPYCTDVARVVNAPIFHVNADDPEAVMVVSRVAAQWRQQFKKDVVIDLVCYRRNGHNEIDEPMFTQPLMYQRIKDHTPVDVQYAERLIEENVITKNDLDAIVAEYDAICEKSFQESETGTVIKMKDWIDSPWSGFFEGKNPLQAQSTGIREETLLHIANRFSSPPPADIKFNLHKGVERILNARREMINERQVDWALAEALAIGSLLKQGTHVRLSGQDVERGTFSHRHHTFHDQIVDKMVFTSLNNMYSDQAPYTISNSSLSEFAVMGFEHGYSMHNANTLVMWEGQFGDFANGAQVIIDQYIAAGETKWIRQSGIVLLLPHGMEGMGPEHSSGRIGRFLQMSNDDPDKCQINCTDFAIKQLSSTNWIVANCSTPANLFHILRRQVLLPFRKPLILFTPKSLLRHPMCRSCLNEMVEDTFFNRVIRDYGLAEKKPKAVKKILFCSGKVYYDLLAERLQLDMEGAVALVRIEQLCPFPFDLVIEETLRYPNAALQWVQEEQKNDGAWTFVSQCFATAFPKRKLSYVGRPTSSSTSTGLRTTHVKELENLLNDAFNI